jgi:hypothetical protein
MFGMVMEAFDVFVVGTTVVPQLTGLSILPCHPIVAYGYV